MQTNFAPLQLVDPHMHVSEKILRSCVHCGFCTATCPTYLLLGDELDSPRGRIYLIKDMLEGNKPATREVVKHIDRCLSCLSCMTTCPSGVHYMHLVDHARAYIQQTYRRSVGDRIVRGLLGAVLPYRNRFRLALLAATLGKPLRPLVAAIPGIGARLAAMLDLAPSGIPSRSGQDPGRKLPVILPRGGKRRRVALLTGCAQAVLKPSINAATIRLLNRHNVDVVLPKGEGCCGALVHHMGQEAIVITASGCGTTIKDYGFMLRDDPDYAAKAKRVSDISRDVTEFLGGLQLLEAPSVPGYTVAYHSACSMQHGQKITDLPKRLLSKTGFRVRDVPEGHICCGSAGTYNILQPELAGQLGKRKAGNIERLRPDLIATGNIGCMTQIGRNTALPIVHTVELLDWATGGPRPEDLDGLPARAPLAASALAAPA